MTEQEIEALWKGQSYEALSEKEIWNQLRKHRRIQKWSKAILIFGTPICLGIWLWRISLAFLKSEPTWGASLLDVIIVSVFLCCILFEDCKFVTDRRKMKELKNDTRSFIEYLIVGTRKEIWELTRFVPSVLGVVVLLATARKLLLIELGHQPLSSIVSLSMLLAAFIIFSIYAFIRTKKFLKPKLESLERSRAAFDD